MYRRGDGFWTDAEAARRAEWLETNGLGGYAASTLSGLQTRRYHGLLVAAAHPPVGRAVLLSKLEETLVVGGERFELSVNRYPGAVHPEGDRFLVEASFDPFPRFVYEAGGARLTRTLFLVNGEDTLVVSWELEGAPGARLEVRPLVAFRDYHALTVENGALDGTLTVEPARVTIRPYVAHPALSFAHTGAVYVHRGETWLVESLLSPEETAESVARSRSDWPKRARPSPCLAEMITRTNGSLMN